MFDPEEFGKAMSEAVRREIAPLTERITVLERQLAEKPDFGPMVAAAVQEAVKAIPVAKDGESVTLEQVKPILKEWQDQASALITSIMEDGLKAAEQAIKEMPIPKDGKSVSVEDIAPLIASEVEKAVAKIPAAKDGIGIAGAMIDREGSLLITTSNGEVKNLGRVEGKDGNDGLSLESFEMEYLPESHEIEMTASCGDRVKSVKFYAGGIRSGGYWREGKSAKAGEAWAYGGNLWIATRDGTTEEPKAGAQDWYLAARKGKDADSVIRHIRPDQPIKLGA